MSNKLLRNIRDEQEQWNDGQTREESAAHLKATCEVEFVQVCMHRDIVLTLCSVLLVQRLLVCVIYRY